MRCRVCGADSNNEKSFCGCLTPDNKPRVIMVPVPVITAQHHDWVYIPSVTDEVIPCVEYSIYERVVASLRKANADTEHFERKYFLTKDKYEDLCIKSANHLIDHTYKYEALKIKFKKAIEQRNECIQVNHMGRESAKLFIKQCDKELGE